MSTGLRERVFALQQAEMLATQGMSRREPMPNELINATSDMAAAFSRNGEFLQARDVVRADVPRINELGLVEGRRYGQLFEPLVIGFDRRQRQLQRVPIGFRSGLVTIR